MISDMTLQLASAGNGLLTAGEWIALAGLVLVHTFAVVGFLWRLSVKVERLDVTMREVVKADLSELCDRLKRVENKVFRIDKAVTD